MKIKLFYGWYMVLAGLVLAMINNSIMGYGWTAFVDPVTATFGWTMAEMSLASSLRSLETGVFNPLWGPVVDRKNPQLLMRIGVVLTAGGLILLSQMQNLWMYYAGFVLVGTGSSLVVGMLPQTVIARWFKKDLGKANGLLMTGNALGGVTVPLVVILIGSLGWRSTIFYTGIIFLVFGMASSFLFRARPEEMGMIPDGREGTANGKRRSVGSDFGTSVKEAIKMRAFWHIAVGTIFQNATISTVMMYAIPYLTDLGMSREWAGTIVSVYTIISACGRVPFGMLSDVFRKSYVVAFCFLLLIIGLILYWQMQADSPFWFIILFAIPYGLGVSGVTATRSPILADYFGVKNFGSIFGVTSIFFAVANVLSPPIAGWIFDTYHDYKSWWLILIGMGVIGLISMLTIPKPRSAEVREPEPEPAKAE